MMHDLPLITLLLLAPAAGIALIWLAPRANWSRGIALGALATTLALALLVVIAFDTSLAGFQHVESLPWIPTLNVHYKVGVDGISLLFLPLTVLLFGAVVLASWNEVRTLPRLYFSLLLLLATATLGVFCALDTILFFLFWELTLAPIYFLVSLWGAGPERRYAATKYTLMMLAGGIPLLLGLLVLAFNHAAVRGAGLSFDLLTLLSTPAPLTVQLTVFALLLIGFAAKVPMFPVHTWLPVIAMEGPVPLTALLVGVKLGAYGLLRYAVPLAPLAAQELSWLLSVVGTLGILYGAVAALAQTNLRRMLAYSSLSHVGLVVLGLSTFSIEGTQGAVLQLLNFVVVASAILLLTGFLQARIGSSDVLNLGGAARSLPRLASFFLLFGFAALGLPGTSGFAAELLIVVSAVRSHTGAGLVALFGMILGAAYFLATYRRTFLGPVRNPVVGAAQDLLPRELAIVAVFALVVLVVGLYPAPVLELIRPAAQAWVTRVS